ncbi:MAG TPA: hypothetical protein VLL54_06725 [Pyrinomonadaceae bacterium]|nr:hypothetical protein [Pyrinomonadaceae bacterium]
MRSIIVILLLLFVALGCKLSQGSDRSTSISIDPNSPKQLVTRSQPLTPSTFSVSARNQFAKQFNVEGSARVHGSFHAAGGSGNDIQVYIVDDENYRLSEQGQAFHGYYISGKVSSGSIDVRLTSGSYNIVFNNKFSFFTNKAIEAEINLEQ